MPYISFVTVARNDDYGGNFLHRVQVFVSGLLSLCGKHGLDAELIVVEWNPPDGNPPLWQALEWPKGPTSAVRFVEVSRGTHRRLPNSKRMPIFEFIAKNVGIRRARGKYVLATNSDLLYNDALIAFFASGRLRKDRFYRIDRHDVDQTIPLDLSVEEQLALCAAHVAGVQTANVPVMPETRLCPQRLHMGAPGDFFLMAREHWHDLRGYPEFETSSVIDCYVCHLAALSGLRQHVLEDPMRIYHQEHDRSELHRRPRTDVMRYRREVRRMIGLGRPTIFNNDSWGLGGEELPEWQIHRV